MDRLTERDLIGAFVLTGVEETGNGPARGEVIDKLADYEDTGLTPGDIQEVVDLFEKECKVNHGEVPAEIKSWMERCTWHVRKVAEQCVEIEKLKAASRWIPVEERLPGEGDCVLVYNGSDVELGLYEPDTCFCHFWDGTKDMIYGVTHWMPLPKPPKGDA